MLFDVIWFLLSFLFLIVSLHCSRCCVCLLVCFCFVCLRAWSCLLLCLGWLLLCLVCDHGDVFLFMIS